MLNLLNWNRPLEVNGVTYNNSTEAAQALEGFEGSITINLKTEAKVGEPQKEQPQNKPDMQTEYRIQVKKYMTEKATPAFDFMKKFNNDNPMPFVVMTGTILEETKGMYKMDLQGKMDSNASNCMHCGRKLTNIVSRNYGIGPVCGGHMNLAAPETVEEFKAREEEIRKTIESVKWTGWVIKSAIKSMESTQSKSRTA